MNLKLSSIRLSLSNIMAAIALLGLADSIYLAVEHYTGAGVKCLITEGCDTVLQSPYSQIYGIPLSVFGLVFYAAMFLMVNSMENGSLGSRIILIWGVIGFSASLFFLYLQLFVIHALCFYCLVSLCTSSALFILSVVLYRRRMPLNF